MGIGLQHLILKESKSNQKNLTLSVSTNFISLSIRDFVSNSLLMFDKKIFNKPLSDEFISEELKKILDSNAIDNQKFDSVKLIQENDFFVLVPDELYSESDKKTYLRYNTETREDDFVAVDNLNNLKIKNVYIPYVNVNNFLIDLYNNIEYYHYNTEFLNKAHEIRTNEKFFAHIDNGKVKIAVFKKDSLVFFNSFEIENASDIIYYILLTLKEQDFEIEKTKITYIIDHNYDDLTNISDNFFNNYKILDKDDNVDFLHA